MLLNTHHADPESAALAIAANRASKVQALRREGHADIADRYAANLHRDVAEWLSSTRAGVEASPSTVARLHDLVTSAQVRNERLAELREEFPHCDVGYVRKNAPKAERLAETYNRKREAIDPDDGRTVDAARRAKQRLKDAVEAAKSAT